MTSGQTLLIERRGKTLLVTPHRSDAAHGLNGVMVRELADVAQACDGDSTIRAVVLTAAGRFVRAGGDVKATAGFNECVSARLGGVAAGTDRRRLGRGLTADRVRPSMSVPPTMASI